MGTRTSSETTEEDVRNRLNSGDFQKVSPPSSPSIDASPTDENAMSHSGILVEKPGSETLVASPAAVSFAADLSTPPISNSKKSKSRINAKAAAAAAAASAEQPRRIVKATPPSKVAAGADADGSGNGNGKDNNETESPAVHHPLSSLASPIGANAATEMPEESIEKNDSKNKRMERVTNKQKSDRERLVQERRRQKGGSDAEKIKRQVQANPYSRFLRAFSINANPTHKRKESGDFSAGDGDPNKRLKFGSPESVGSGDQEQNPSGTGDKEDALPFFKSPWFAAASVATVAVLLFAIVRTSKKN